MTNKQQNTLEKLDALEVYVIFYDRNTLMRCEPDRLLTAMAITKNVEDARKAILIIANLREDAIENNKLRNPSIDLSEFCRCVTKITGEHFEVCRFELDPRFPGPLRS